ncbi:Probable BOI-related E3 ubiquitin-protein ligase 3 [Linum perenne]
MINCIARKMLGGNSGNPLLPVFMDDNRLPYQNNASNQLQLFSNLPAGCNVNAVNYFGSEHISPMVHPNKRSREADDFGRQQKLQISLNYNICQDEVDRSASVVNPNAVSTGLRLSYDDEERNSSLTSASGSMTAKPSMILSLQRHAASFLAAIEKGVAKKIREKDIEIDNMNRRNKELIDKIKQVATEAQNWHYRAKYNESVVNVLKTNLQQAISQGAEQVKEGFGDSELDDAAAGGPSKPVSRNQQHMNCRACKSREVSVLLMPCRHLCLCIDCDMFINVCPVCQLIKTTSIQVYLS